MTTGRERCPLTRRERRERDDARIYRQTLRDYDRQIRAARSPEAWVPLINERAAYADANRQRYA
jgi:hypothetical protein